VTPALGIQPGSRRGAASEDAIIEFLLIAWVTEIRAGDRIAAERQARQTLDRLVQAGLGFHRAASGMRFFDPAEVINFAAWLGLEADDGFWLDRWVPHSRRFVWTEHGLAPSAVGCPPPPTSLPPRRFTVRFERLFNLRGHRPGERVRVRLPRPIEDRALSGLEVRPIFDARFTEAPGRLDAQIEAPPSLEVELGFEADFTAYPSGGEADTAPLSAADTALYTRPHDGMIKVDQAVQGLATDLAGAELDPWGQIRRFWDFGFERLRYGVVHYDEIDLVRPVGWALENGWCDCQLGSGLLASLCRARGIPARLVAGYLMDAETPDRHYWAEAFIEQRGWLPLDLSSSWSYSRGGRDPAWRDYYFGRLDYRMKTEVLPRLFNGPGQLRFPPAWHQLSSLRDQGMEMSFHDSTNGALIHRDRVAIIGADDDPLGPR